MSLESLLVVAGALFAIGFFGVLTRRHAIAVLMSIELMFNAVNVTLVALSRYVVPLRLLQAPGATGDEVVGSVLTGQAFAIFIIIVAAAEVALGLAIILALYRTRATVDLTQYSLMKR